MFVTLCCAIVDTERRELTGSDGEEFGLARVVEFARSAPPTASAREIGTSILAAVEQFASGTALDDATIVVMRVVGEGRSRELS